jgi:hypothetical protein
LQEDLPADVQSYAQDKIGVVEILVIRIAPDPLLGWTNGYPELPVDRQGFRGAIPRMGK